MSKGGAYALYAGLDLAGEAGDLLFGVSDGSVEASLDGLCNAVALLRSSAHGFPDGGPEALGLTAHIPEAELDVIGSVAEVVQGVVGVPGPVHNGVCPCTEAGPHVLGGVFCVLRRASDPLQAVYRVIELSDGVVKPKIHAKSELPAVCHWPHLLSAKR